MSNEPNIQDADQVKIDESQKEDVFNMFNLSEETCTVCESDIELDNWGGLFPGEDGYLVLCDNPSCYIELNLGMEEYT